MRQIFLLIPVLFFCSAFLHGQSVGIGTQTPDSSAIFELKSSTQGLLIPRMTQAQRVNIPFPGQGLMVYQTDIDTGFYYFKGSTWRSLINSDSNNTRNIILYARRDDSNSPLEELWRANIDGSGQSKIDVILPTGLKLSLTGAGSLKLTPDNQRIIFQARNMANQTFLFSCSIDGSNVTKIVDGPLNGVIVLGCVN